MDITINNGVLAHELRLLNRIILAKPPLPALGYIQFKVDDDQLTLSATDLEVMMTVKCAAKTTGTGAVMLPAKTLLDLVEGLVRTDVIMMTEKNTVKVTAGDFASRLQTVPADDFPTLPSPQGTLVTLSASMLKNMIDRVQYAIAEKQQPHCPLGALLQFKPFGLAAIDGQRLSLTTDGQEYPDTPSVILPSKTLDVLLAHCDGVDTIEFSQAGNHLFFSAGGRLLISRTIDGEFPNYTRMIPKECPISITVERAKLKDALRRVGVFSEESQAINFIFEPNLVRLTSGSATGEADEKVTIQYEGAPLKLCTKGKFVLDFLEHAYGSMVTIQMLSDAGPMLLKDGDRFLNVVTMIKQQ